MKNEFVIQWKNQVNGRAGRGSKVFSREEAEHLVEELNREYPQIFHEIVRAPEPAAAPEPVGVAADEEGEEEETDSRRRVPVSVLG